MNSLSKTYNMAGCRIGYAVGNPNIIQALKEVKSQLDYGIFGPIQDAAVAALTGPQDCVKVMRDTYQKRRDILLDGLNKAGWYIEKPKATMFSWASIPPGFDSSFTFSMELLNKTGVAVVPGVGFGKMGEGFVRLALVQDAALLEEAVERIASSEIFRCVAS